jgi:hypothetical protein
MIEVIPGGSEIFFGRFGMEAVARHALARRQVLREKISDSRQGVIARDQFSLSGFNLSDSPPHLGKLCAGNLGRNILRQAFD